VEGPRDDSSKAVPGVAIIRDGYAVARQFFTHSPWYTSHPIELLSNSFKRSSPTCLRGVWLSDDFCGLARLSAASWIRTSRSARLLHGALTV